MSKLTIDDFAVGSAGGKTDWKSPDYDSADQRYDIEISAGASKMTVRSEQESRPPRLADLR